MDLIVGLARDYLPIIAGVALAYGIAHLLRVTGRRKVPNPTRKIVAGVAGTTVVVFAFLWTFRWGSHFYGGYAGAVAFFERPGTVAMFAIDAVPTPSSSAYRLNVIDLTKGKRTLRRVVYDTTVLVGLSEHRVWLYDADRGLHARDPFTAQIRVRSADIEQQNPSLRGKLRRVNPRRATDAYRFDRATKGMWLQLRDASWYRLDLKTLRASKRDEPGDPPSTRCPRRKGARTRLSGEKRRKFIVDSMDTGAAFLYGRQLSNLGKCQPLELGSPPSRLIMHRESLDTGAPRLISRVSLGGKTIWSWKLGNALRVSFLGARFVSGKLILVTSKRAVALQPDSGKTAWEYDF